MLTKEQAQERADRLSEIVYKKMGIFISYLEQQIKWVKYEIEKGTFSKESNSVIESEKDYVRTEIESIIDCHTKAIGSMKAIQALSAPRPDNKKQVKG